VHKNWRRRDRGRVTQRGAVAVVLECLLMIFFLSREYSRGDHHCRFYFIEKQQQQLLLLYREVKELHKGKTKERRPEQGQRKQTQPKRSRRRRKAVLLESQNLEA
jgi:hypothetical protein